MHSEMRWESKGKEGDDGVSKEEGNWSDIPAETQLDCVRALFISIEIMDDDGYGVVVD